MKGYSTIVPASNEDPDKLFACPFEATHLVKACSFNQHILKCLKNHGNHGLRVCTFSQIHFVPEAEYQRHLLECPDRGMIQQDIDAAQRQQTHSLPPVDHYPVWNKPSSTEDWDDEVSTEQEVISQDEKERGMAVANEAMVDDELEIIQLLPEHPPDWETMTANQKKNYRRKYNRQREKLKEKGLTPADVAKSKDPRHWTKEEKQDKLRLMISLYPPPKVGGDFIDYKSILNQYCQKNRINAPKYMEAPGTMGGYATKVTVKGEEYCSQGSHTTKKSAAQSAAAEALISMEVPNEAMNPVSLGSKLRPARTAHEVQILRLHHEAGMSHNNSQIQVPTRPLQQNHQPHNAQNSNGNSARTTGMAKTLLTPQAFTKPSNDIAQSTNGLSVGAQSDSGEWHTVGTRRPLQKGGRGRGRGTALSSFI